jgi:hypothetical protein
MNDVFAAKIASELRDIAQTLKLILQALPHPISPPVAIKGPTRSARDNRTPRNVSARLDPFK